MRRRGGRGTGDESPPDPTKGPWRWKASRIITSRRLSRAGGHGGLGGFLTLQDTPAKAGLIEGGRGRGDRDVRGSFVRGRRGKKTPTLAAEQANHLRGARPKQTHRHSEHSVSSTIRRSDPDAVKAFGSPVKPLGAQTPGGAHAAKAAAVQPGTHEVRVHAARSGGRSRSDASRVLPAGRSQGLVAKNMAGR